MTDHDNFRGVSISTVVLVHGAFVDGSCWRKLVPVIESRGHTVVAETLPFHGSSSGDIGAATLDAYVQQVVGTIDAHLGPIVLVGHSMGGVIVSAAAEMRPTRITRLVYIAAYVLADGQSQLDLALTDTESMVLQRGVISDDGTQFTMPIDERYEAFFHDCAIDEVNHDIANIRPEPIAPIATAIHVSPRMWGSVPKRYILTRHDRAVTPALQRQMVANAGINDVTEFDAGHSPHLSCPDDLAAAILLSTRHGITA